MFVLNSMVHPAVSSISAVISLVGMLTTSLDNRFALSESLPGCRLLINHIFITAITFPVVSQVHCLVVCDLPGQSGFCQMHICGTLIVPTSLPIFFFSFLLKQTFFVFQPKPVLEMCK